MLTPKQLACFQAIKSYTARNGYAPTYEELADTLGLKSKSGVSRLVLGLEARGKLRRIPNRARAFEVIE